MDTIYLVHDELKDVSRRLNAMADNLVDVDEQEDELENAAFNAYVALSILHKAIMDHRKEKRVSEDDFIRVLMTERWLKNFPIINKEEDKHYD